MPFPHRVNSDGTIDSICDQCFVTVGTSVHESDLPQFEGTHACEPARLAYYRQLNFTSKRPPSPDLSAPQTLRISPANTR